MKHTIPNQSATARKPWAAPLCSKLGVNLTAAGPDNDVVERTAATVGVGSCPGGYAWSKSTGNCTVGGS